MKITSLAAALALAAAAPLARADTLNVPSTDYPTIQSGVDAAVEGDVVLVGPGDYAEEVVVDGRTGIEIRGKDGPVVAGGAADHTLRIENSSGISVTGLVVDAATLDSVRVAASTDVRLERLEVRSTAGGGIASSGNDGLRISKCTFSLIAGDAVSDLASTGVVVEKCRFEAIGAAAVRLSADGLQGSDGALVSKNRVDGAQVGILAGGIGVEIEKNRLAGISDLGISLGALSPTSGGVVSKNRVEIGGGIAVQSLHPDALLEKNVLEGGGIESLGTGAAIDRNTISGARFYGIDAGGEGLTITRNRVRDVRYDGIRVRDAAAGFGLERNLVSGSGNGGIVLEASGGAADRNRVAGARTVGFLVSGTGNDLTRNQARGSGDFDMADTNAEGANTYLKNHFDTIAFDYVP